MVSFAWKTVSASVFRSTQLCNNSKETAASFRTASRAILSNFDDLSNEFVFEMGVLRSRVLDFFWQLADAKPYRAALYRTLSH